MGKILIVGAGQYGRLVKEIIYACGCYDDIGFADDKADCAVGTIAELELLRDRYDSAVVAIGDCRTRAQLIDKLDRLGYDLPIIVHPMACVSPSAQIGKSTVIEAMAVINSEAKVGVGCIISAGAVLNHNCCVKSFCHINCASVVGANAVIEEYTKSEISAVYR